MDTLNTKINIASIFAGCGGMDYAFHKNTNEFNIVYANDIDRDSCNTYENNYKFKPDLKDIKKVDNIPDCDVVIGGFPCQGFSIANQNRNAGDDRNSLYK